MTQHPHIKKHTGTATIGLAALVGLGGLTGCSSSTSTHDSSGGYDQGKQAPTYTVTGTPISIGGSYARMGGHTSIIIETDDGPVLITVPHVSQGSTKLQSQLEAVIKAMMDEKIDGPLSITQVKTGRRTYSTLEIPSIDCEVGVYDATVTPLGPQSKYTP